MEFFLLLDLSDKPTLEHWVSRSSLIFFLMRAKCFLWITTLWKKSANYLGGGNYLSSKICKPWLKKLKANTVLSTVLENGAGEALFFMFHEKRVLIHWITTDSNWIVWNTSKHEVQPSYKCFQTLCLNVLSHKLQEETL